MKPLLIFFVMCLASGCHQLQPSEHLFGQWEAASMQVSDSTWQVQVDPIQLTFSPDLRYHLEWYGGQVETGKFHINGDWLHIQSAEISDRKLRVIHLDTDSLLLSGTLLDRRTVIGFHKSEHRHPSE